MSAISGVQADPAFLNHSAWNCRWSDRQKSVAYARQAQDLARNCSAMRMECARAARTLAWQAKWRGDFDGTLKQVLACEAAVKEAEAPDLRGDCYSLLGVVYYSRHRMDLAQDVTERGLQLNDISDPTWIDLMTTQSTIQRYMGHAARAGITLVRARDRAKGPELARVEHNLARWMQQQDDNLGALTHATRSIELCEAEMNRVVLPYAHEIAGAAAGALNREDEATAHFRSGLELAVQDDDQRAQCQLLLSSAAVSCNQGKLGRAVDSLRYGREIAERISYPLWQKRFALALASSYEALGDLAASIEHHKDAWRFQNMMRDDCIGARPRAR